MEDLAMLFCISANYTPKGLEAMGKSPNTNRQEAVQKLLSAADAKFVAMYYTIADGPGAMVIIRCRSEHQASASIVWRRSGYHPAEKG
jgi:uncharacterized protein with GYD domain